LEEENESGVSEEEKEVFRLLEPPDEEGVQLLVEKIGCSEEHAKSILATASWDVNAAIELIGYLSEKNLYIIKGRFKSTKVKAYGLFLLIINVLQGILERVDAVVCRSSRICAFDVKAKWDVFEKVVHNIRMKKIGVVVKLTNELREELKAVFQMKDKAVFQALINPVRDDLENILVAAVGKVIDDTKPALSIDVDQISALREKDKEVEVSQEEKEKKELIKEERGELVIKLNITPVIAPVSGIPITELTQGERILVEVVDTTELGKFLAELMGGRKEDQTVPLVVSIEEISPLPEDEQVRLVVKFGPGVFGEAVVPRNIKLHPSSQPLREVPKEKREISSKELLIFLIALGILNFIFLLLLFFLR
jgi:hypothetical protein